MDKLGIEPSLLLAQIINFAIIVVVLSRLLYKPILSMLEKRRHEIEDGLRLTEKMRQEEEKMQEKKERLLAEARKEGAVVMEEARKQGSEEAVQIVAAARREADAVIAKGKSDVAQLRAAMEKDVRKTAVELATLMSKRLLSSVLTSEDKHRVFAKHVKELEGLEA